MLIIIVAVIFCFVGQAVVLKAFWPAKNGYGYRDWMDLAGPSAAWWLFGVPILAVVCYLAIPLGGGLIRGYSDGVREGYITKVSDKGVVWKTWEGQIQMGTGEMAALQQPFDFSISKNKRDLHEAAMANLGKRVRITYVEWWVMPYSVGSSGYEVVSIEPVPDAK